MNRNYQPLNRTIFWLWATLLLTTPLVSLAHDNLAIVCPSNSSVTAAPGECGVTLDWQQFNWYSTIPLTDTLFEPPQGTFLGIGPSVLTITGVDINGDTASCSFTYTVVDAGANSALICKDQVQVILDENCQREITPEMMLEPPGPYGCPELYTTTVLTQFGGPLGNVVDLSFAGMEWVVKIVYLPTQASCWGSIEVRTDTLPPAIKCPADTVILCNVPVLPAFTGSPFASGCFELDDLDLSYSDQTNNSFCDGDSIAFTLVRTWTAVDSFNNVTTCSQHITGIRARVDQVVFPPDFNGIASPFLICNDSQTVEALADTSITGRPTLAGLPLGFFTLPCDFTVAFEDSVEQICGAHYLIKRHWEVIDLCLLEESHHTQIIEIVDSQAPVFDVLDTLYISTLSGCTDTVELPPIDFIYDCSPYTVEIWTPWDTIQGDGGPLQLPLTPDTVAALYVVTDACGNDDVGITILAISPDLVANCPPDLTIGYDEYFNNYKTGVEQGNYSVLDPLGLPELYVNCEATQTQNVMVEVDTCGRGNMTRTFTVSAQGISETCQQNITLVHVSDFVVEFPKDTTIFCGFDTLDTGEPILHNADIERIQISYTDHVFNTVPTACFKIQRTWKVVNTCVVGNAPDQEVEELPESMLGLPMPECDLDGDGDCDSHTYRDSWTSSSQPGFAEATQQFNPDTDPDLNPWDGVLIHKQVFDVYDNVPPVFVNGCDIPEVVMEFPECTAAITLPTPEILECTELSLVMRINIDGEWHDGPGPHLGLVPGVYDVEYTAFDQCNNSSNCSTTVTVINPAPEAVCKPFLNIELSVNCTVTLFAADLDGGTMDNCPNPLFFSFSAQFGDVQRTFNECDIGSHVLFLYVIDNYGKVDLCATTVNVQEAQGTACECFTEISGKVKTETGSPVRFAEVLLNTSSGFADTVITDGTGNYFFEVPPGDDATISAVKYLNPANGVTTFDGVLIAKHILNVLLLDSPYKIIAADVNGSKSVTTFDLVVMQKLILNITTEFPVPSWQMIPESFTFPDPQNPWATSIDSVLFFPSVNQSYASQNFIAIKTGDVNNSANPLNLKGNLAQNRNASNILKLTARQTPLPGNRVKVGIYPEDKEVLTIQYGLLYDARKYILDSLVPVFYDEQPNFDFNSFVSGSIATSWFANNTYPLRYNSHLPLFELYFTCKGKLPVSEPILQLSDSTIMTEVYADLNSPLALRLVMEGAMGIDSELQAGVPSPNPYNDRTTIHGRMPGPGNVLLYIYSTSGRVTTLKRTFSNDGYFSFTIEAGDTPAVGKYFYSIRTAFGHASGVLIRR